MINNLLSCNRVSAWLRVHQIVELQLTIPLQKSATKFYDRASIFPPYSLQNYERHLQQIFGPCVVVEKPL